MMVRMDIAVVMYVMPLSIATLFWGQRSGERLHDPKTWRHDHGHVLELFGLHVVASSMLREG